MNMAQQRIRESMLEKFDGCDSSEPGSPAEPSIWLFGIEPGWSKRDQEAESAQVSDHDDSYSIERQMKWPFNRNAFKLLAAMHGDGHSARTYRDFAARFQPFVRGSKGYFKGNLYPYPCNSVDHWHEYAAVESGFQDKASYVQWCQEFRLPAVKKWVDEYQPTVFIGVGLSNSSNFAQAVFGKDVILDEKQFAVNGHGKRILYKNLNEKTLVVLPHLSGSRNGLNSFDAIQIAGEFINKLIKTRAE